METIGRCGFIVSFPDPMPPCLGTGSGVHARESLVQYVTMHALGAKVEFPYQKKSVESA